MIKKYTDTEFENGKSRQLFPLECIYCGTIFYRKKHIIQGSKNKEKTFDFCSCKCGLYYKNPPQYVKCTNCNKEFKKEPSQIKRSTNNFCCQSCAAIYNNTHKTKGTRISKLEKWLHEQLPIIYPNLNFHFNRKDAINSELDIYIPSLKLAFELNGIFHYEPIYGTEKLSSIQNNDNRKMQACLEKDIELCIIDSSSLIYFKEKNVQKYLNIIINLINLKNGAENQV